MMNYRSRCCCRSIRGRGIRALPIAAALVIAVAIALVPSLAAQSLEIPPLGSRVNDYADMIDPETERELEELLADLEQTDSTQIAVLTIASLDGASLEEYSIRVAEEWEIGTAERDNGAILLVARDDRKIRIETGYGLEGTLTDLMSGRIIDHEIAPAFRLGQFDRGIRAGVTAMAEVVRGEYVAEAEPSRDVSSGFAPMIPFLVIFLVITLLGGRRSVSGIIGAILFPVLALLFLPIALPFLIVFLVLGFMGGMLLPAIFFPSWRRGSRSTRSGRRPWHGGGGFRSGGFSSGGGFSGGGGGFGGGGASGGW